MAAYTVNTYKPVDRVGLNQEIGTASSTQLHPLGDVVRARDVSGTRGEAKFVYLKGVANVSAGSVCLITDTYAVTLIAARDIGTVALATATVDAATKYGWFQIEGQGVAKCDTIAANAACYIDGTAGRVDDLAVAGDAVAGMRTVTADDTNTCVVMIAPGGARVGDTDNA